MITLLIHLWASPGREREFRAYEDAALRIFERHGGQVLEVLRPDASLSADGAPLEIHLLRIGSLEAWQAFREDAELRSLAAQRAACVAQTQLFACLAPQVPAP